MAQIGGIKGIGSRSGNMENHPIPPLIDMENGCLKVAGCL